MKELFRAISEFLEMLRGLRLTGDSYTFSDFFPLRIKVQYLFHNRYKALSVLRGRVIPKKSDKAFLPEVWARTPSHPGLGVCIFLVCYEEGHVPAPNGVMVLKLRQVRGSS